MTPETADRGTTDDALPAEVKKRLDSIWRKAYAARDQDDLRDLYAEWTATYEEDHRAIGYEGHVIASQLLARCLPPDPELRVLDAGAGTGLAGERLAELGYARLTGLDLSRSMLAVAGSKGVYEELLQADLGEPLDELANDTFDGAVLVGVFSYGQAPAHALDEIVRIVRPGGVIVFTMRTDFHEEDAMGVRSRMAELRARGAWRRLEVTEPRPYLPKKDPDAMFRVWAFEVLPTAALDPGDDFREAARAALTTPSPLKSMAHHHIWDAISSRLYDAYIQRPEYYLNECEEEILRTNAGDFLGDRALCVELGCGSGRKMRHVFDAVLADAKGPIDYMPIDLSPGALETAAAQMEEAYGEEVRVDPRLGHFDETLASIPAERAKAVFFLGGSIGNFETHDETVDFLASVREKLTPKDRFVVGFDLCKDMRVFEQAYNAGEPNRLFFVHMLRRMNHTLGADFDLDAFQLASSYEEVHDVPGCQGQTGRVALRVRTSKSQHVSIPGLDDLRVHLEAGDTFQVGISRKFSPDAVAGTAALAGLRVRSLWFDSKHYFALAELVRDDAPVG